MTTYMYCHHGEEYGILGAMDVDHAEFIKRHSKKGLSQKQQQQDTRQKILVSTGFVILYFILCVVLASVFDMDKVLVVGAGIIVIVIAATTFWLQRVFEANAYRHREHKLIRSILEGSRIARSITDSHDNVIYYNKCFEALCKEHGPPSLQSLTKLFEYDAEKLKHFQALAEKAHRGLMESVELCSGKGENERWFLVTAQPVQEWKGYVHWRIDEITEQRELDRSIREEREKLIDFTDNAPVGFFSVDEEGRFVFVNATFARWVGQDIESLLQKGTLHSCLVDPPTQDRPYDVILGGGAKQITEIAMKGPGGLPFMASINQGVVIDAEGRVRTRGVVHDLTSEREMRQALQASEDRFQRFFEEAPLGVAMVDSDGQISDANAAFALMLDLEVESLEGRIFEDLIDQNDRDAALAAIERIGRGQQMSAPLEVMLLGNRNTNRRTAVQMHARRFKGSENLVLHFIDLTQQKALEQQFVQSQKMQAIGQLAGGVAHDFNNLLTAIIGFCDLLLLRHKPGDPSFGDIMQIKQNSNRAANLVRQLLAFSRQQTLRPKVQDITDVLSEVSNLLRRLIGANIELGLVHGQNLGLVRVDVGQIEQVLMNLAVNARDAMEQGGKLTITTENFENEKMIDRGGDDMPPGQWVQISVQDTGCGIPLENLVRIFEPFFTTKDVGDGTGLGLATVYGIIRQTDGYLHVESEIDKGTTFHLYLPQLSEEEARDALKSEKDDEEEVPRDLTGTDRILLVEDEAAVRTFSSRALTNKGYEVLEADCGEAALTLIEEEKADTIDLLITDVMMPGMDGPTMADKIRKENPKLKIIFISGYSEEKLKDQIEGDVFFLPKPFTLKQLAAKVKDVLSE